MRLTTRLLILMFLSVLVPLVGLSWFLKQEITENILKEKRDKLFGLARQLDGALEGTFDDILLKEHASASDRDTKIAILNSKLRGITDFVASGNDGVGVGYYSKDLDAVLTYGPSDQFQYMVGRSIFVGHKGYEVMATGKPMVQTGSLVRGDILNCMWPINRDGQTIGYIWSNETLDMIGQQLEPIIRRVFVILAIIFFLIYLSLTVTMKGLLDTVTSIRKGIEVLFHTPTYHIPQVPGELSAIVTTINDLVDTTNLMKCYNKNILESVTNGVLAISSPGIITRANKAFFEMFPGFTESSIDQPYRDVLEPEVAALVSAGLDGDGQAGGELSFRGSTLEVHGSAMYDEAGARLGAVFVFRDITVMRRYEREIQEKERAAMLGEMALAVVHEVKNPMTSVKGFTQLLGRPDVDELKRAKYLHLIDDELNRVNRLLNEMLVYGGRSRLDPRRCDIAALVREAVERNDWTQGGALEECRPLVRAIPDGDYAAEVDAFKLGQVLDNLLKNACDAVAAKGRGRIVVLIQDLGQAVAVRIVDSGIGIEPEVLPRIGNPLFSTKKTGNGFGIAISRKIVEAHGGSLFIDSVAGVYTKLSIFLPRGQKQKREEA
ncbi:MAG TPA: ATP-binding protein [bacterium]|nr:ATP-binding protein [bacterium]